MPFLLPNILIRWMSLDRFIQFAATNMLTIDRLPLNKSSVNDSKTEHISNQPTTSDRFKYLRLRLSQSLWQHKNPIEVQNKHAKISSSCTTHTKRYKTQHYHCPIQYNHCNSFLCLFFLSLSAFCRWLASRALMLDPTYFTWGFGYHRSHKSKMRYETITP